MTESQKWQAINATTSIEELQEAILAIADADGNIMGRTKPWPAKKQAEYVEGVVKGTEPPNRLTHSYGIRQQAVYLNAQYF